MSEYVFRCAECNKVFSLTAHSYTIARERLKAMTVCPVGSHPCLISMNELASDDIEEEEG